jgi:hypothetical protein
MVQLGGPVAKQTIGTCLELLRPGRPFGQVAEGGRWTSRNPFRWRTVNRLAQGSRKWQSGQRGANFMWVGTVAQGTFVISTAGPKPGPGEVSSNASIGESHTWLCSRLESVTRTGEVTKI